MIRERVSSATVLLLAYTGKNLRYFHVRRNAIILRCDWPKSPEWTWEFYSWLQRSSRYQKLRTKSYILSNNQNVSNNRNQVYRLFFALGKSILILLLVSGHMQKWKMKFRKYLDLDGTL